MFIRRTAFGAGAALGSWLANSTAAQAHFLLPEASGMAAGLAHPLLGIDHLVAMAAVGIWASQLGGRALWLVPVSSLGSMLIGAILGWQGIIMPMLEPGILISLVLIGGLIAWRFTPGLLIALAAVGIAAVWHGSAHANDAGAAVDRIPFAAGFLASTAALHLIGLSIGIATRTRAPIPRFLGAIVLAAGTLFLVADTL